MLKYGCDKYIRTKDWCEAGDYALSVEVLNLLQREWFPVMEKEQKDEIEEKAEKEEKDEKEELEEKVEKQEKEQIRAEEHVETFVKDRCQKKQYIAPPV